MARKKLADMTPIEKADHFLEGMTNEDAESIAVHILGQLVAKQIYVFENEPYIKDVMMKVAKSADEYGQANAGLLAAGHTLYKEKIAKEKKRRETKSRKKDSAMSK